jgi:hypothetical protein
LLNTRQDLELVTLLNSFPSDSLSQLLPSLTNSEQLSYPLVYWFIIFERPVLVDYLVKRQTACILHRHEISDALTFSIRMNKHQMTDHLL